MSHDHHSGASEEGPRTCIIVHPDIHSKNAIRDAEDMADEAIGLAHAIELQVEHIEVCKVGRIQPGHFLGKGQSERIASIAEEVQPNVIIFNHTLSPVQQRNLEKAWNAKVIDRTGLILEIFGARAQTKEGGLQVELASLEYQRSRLVRSWTHLERQRGATGFIGGPGETQIEIDRRLISERITKIKKELEKVRRTRELGRKARESVPFPVVALVGYTNAGKSTLFNTLTDSKIFAKDLLFATLDPTLRRLELPNGQVVILSDTVGFISDLPTHLVAAFRSTLEQTLHADVILHVIDASRPDYKAQKADVIEILTDLGIQYEDDPRVIEVYNKVDVLGVDDVADFKRLERFDDNVTLISAIEGIGVDALFSRIMEITTEQYVVANFDVPYSAGQALSWLYEHADVQNRKDDAQTVHITVNIERANIQRFEAMFGIQPIEADDDPANESASGA